MWTGYEPTPDCGTSNHASPRAIKTTWQQHVLYFECIIMHVPEYTLALWMIGSVCRACMTSLFVHSLIARHAGVCTKITRGVHRVYSPLSHRVQLTNCLPVSSGMKLPPLPLSLSPFNVTSIIPSHISTGGRSVTKKKKFCSYYYWILIAIRISRYCGLWTSLP